MDDQVAVGDGDPDRAGSQSSAVDSERRRERPGAGEHVVQRADDSPGDRGPQGRRVGRFEQSAVISTLRITQTWSAGSPVLRLEGTLDLAGTAAVLRAVTRAAQACAHCAVCDLSELRDIPEQHLLTVFPAAGRRLGRWPQHDLFVAAASPFLTRRMAQLRIQRFLTVHGSVAESLAADRAGETSVHHHLDLTPGRGSPAQARHSLDVLPPQGLAPWREAADLVVSERATNAVRHAEVLHAGRRSVLDRSAHRRLGRDPSGADPAAPARLRHRGRGL